MEEDFTIYMFTADDDISEYTPTKEDLNVFLSYDAIATSVTAGKYQKLMYSITKSDPPGKRAEFSEEQFTIDWLSARIKAKNEMDGKKKEEWFPDELFIRACYDKLKIAILLRTIQLLSKEYGFKLEILEHKPFPNLKVE